MGLLIDTWSFWLQNLGEFRTIMEQHLIIVATSVIPAILVALTIAIFAIKNDRAKQIIMTIGNITQTIPTLAIIAIVFPFTGIGALPVILGLSIYAILPILTNTVSGIENVDEDVIKAGVGMGMTDNQILRRIQIPIALPVIFAGIRTSTVIVIGGAYLAVFIGGGGLGKWVIGGLQLFNYPMVLAGAIPGVVLAVGTDLVLGWIENYIGGTATHDSAITA